MSAPEDQEGFRPGKNFRLPADVRPSLCEAELRLDIPQGSFEGELRLRLELQAPRQVLWLHAIELDIEQAAVAVGDAMVPSRVAADPESQTVALRFPSPLPAGTATLSVRWRGRFSAGLRGLYRAGGLAVTQFEAADARRVFPCLDEPAFKARWRLSLTGVPRDAVAIANAPIDRDEPDGTGARRVRFAETPPLSSYLVALIVGELVSSDERAARGVPVRTWAVPAKRHLTGFAQEVAASVLPLLEDYFGLPYAFGKLDQIGVPDFEAGAMENAGAITFRETALLLDPATAALAVQKRVAEVVTHELAHQWFGNLVTMVWWDDLWLNEAFATWMAYKIVDRWRPEWRVWREFDAGKGAALGLDALRSTHPIRSEVHNAEEAGESFDLITYEKGGAVLRMIESYMGEDNFREGIRAYMGRHREANATAGDLWRALTEAACAPVDRVADTWIHQAGYPLLGLTLDGSTLSVRQQRFLADPGAPAEATLWPVPVVLRFRDGAGVKEQRVLLEAAEQNVVLQAEGEIAWCLGNAGARGFYRVAHQGELLPRLAAAAPELASAERMALLSDEWALVRAARSPVSSFLELALRFGGEEDHAVLGELVGRLALVEHRLVDDAARPKLQSRIAALFAPALAGLGWQPAPGEPDEIRLRRAAVLRAVTLIARETAAVAEAERRFAALATGEGDGEATDPNLHEIVVATAARRADATRFARLREMARTEIDPARRRRYLHALAMVETPELLDEAVRLAFTDEVAMQDIASYYGTLLGNPATRDRAFAALQARWPELHRKAESPMLLRRMVEALGALITRADLQAVESFLAAHPLEAARQAVAQTLERLRMDVELRERLLPDIARWLA